MKKIAIVIVFFVLLTLALYLYYREGGLPVNSRNKSTTIFVIKRGTSVNQIVKDLYNAGLIRDKIVFFITIKKLGLENKIQAGDFRLSSAMSASETATSLTKGTLDTWVTLIEGLRREEVAYIVSQNTGVPETELVRRSKEGHLFPDTYLIPKNVTVDNILTILENNFEKKYQQALQKRTIDNKLTKEEIVTLASLVEKEARSEKNKNIVASILYKRLKKGWPLQIDATIQYASGYQENEKTWWKKSLTKNDLAINSPYNTYKNRGLPPTPIANPGLISIMAAMNASENTPYWYYITSRDGSVMHYATTIEEHNENVKKYLR